MRILGISGSLRRGSHNLTLLRAAATQLPPDAELEEYRDLAAIPGYNEDLDTAGAPAVVSVATGDRDSGRRDHRHTRVLQLGAGRAQERARLGLPALAERQPARQARERDRRQRGSVRRSLGTSRAAQILTTIGADVIDDELPVGQADQAFDRCGQLADPELRDRLAEVVAALRDKTCTAIVA